MKHKGKTMMAAALAVCLAALTACGNSENTSGSSDTSGTTAGTAASDTGGTTASGGEQAAEDTAEIVVAYFTSTDVNAEATSRVQEAINELTLEKINTEVTLMPIAIGSWSQQINLMIAGGDDLDLAPTFFYGSGTFDSMRAANQLMPLNDLLDEYGQDILAEIPQEYLDTTTYDGNIYAVPADKDEVSSIYYAMRTDILEELGLLEQAQNISSMQDVEEILAAVAENTQLTPLYGAAVNNGVIHFGNVLVTGEFEDAVGYNKLVNDYIVTLDSDPTTVVNLYETPEFQESVELIHDWYNKGYIYRDATTTDEINYDTVKNNVCFSFFYAAENATKNSGLAGCGYDMTVVKVYDSQITTSTVNTINWTIPVTSREPEAAMKFMNLMYCDKELIDLLNYGIEGVDYTVLEDGTYGPVTDGATSSSGYPLNLTWLFGNQYLSGVWTGDEPDLREQSREINDNAELSPLLGFAASTDGFDNQISAITSAYSEYIYGLTCGVTVPSEVLPEFNEKLETAGINDLVAAVQEQLDTWLEEQGQE